MSLLKRKIYKTKSQNIGDNIIVIYFPISKYVFAIIVSTNLGDY